MPDVPEKKIEFADDTINTAGAIATDQGKSNFEKQKETLKQGISNAATTPQEQPQVPHVVIKNLRTFQGDVAEAIKHQHASVVSIALAEQTKQNKQEQQNTNEDTGTPQNEIARILGKKLPPGLPIQKAPAVPPPVKPVTPIIRPQPVRTNTNQTIVSPQIVQNTLTIAVSIVLIIVGVGAVVGFYILQKKPPTIAVQAPVDQTIISFNTKESITIASQKREELLTDLNTIRNTAGKTDNTITYLALTKTVGKETVSISTEELFALLQTSIPGPALRSFDPQFMLGMYTLSGNQPFLIVKLNSFENAFAGMLTWEKTLNKDLGSLFSARSIPITSQAQPVNGSSTQVAPVTRIVNVDAQVNGTFEDVTIQNKDARVLKNVRGEDIILYSFLDNKTLLITANEQIFHEILNKYIAQKLVR